jgi:hypothetical protein
MYLGPYVRSFVSSRRVANKSRNDSGDANRDDKIYGEDGSFAGPFDTQDFKETIPRVVKLENGMQALETGGYITSYLGPGVSGKIKDRLVDTRLVDQYGVWSVDELTEGQLADYLAEERISE